MSLEKEDMGPFFYVLITAGDFIWPYDKETRTINQTIIKGCMVYLFVLLLFIGSIL